MGFLALAACKKGSGLPNNIVKYYAGNWEISVPDPRVDTTFMMSIDQLGEFYHTVTLNGINGAGSGKINNDGLLKGTIKVGDQEVGQMGGQFNPSLTGTGYFYSAFIGDTIPWSAAKL